MTLDMGIGRALRLFGRDVAFQSKTTLLSPSDCAKASARPAISGLGFLCLS